MERGVVSSGGRSEGAALSLVLKSVSGSNIYYYYTGNEGRGSLVLPVSRVSRRHSDSSKRFQPTPPNQSLPARSAGAPSFPRHFSHSTGPGENKKMGVKAKKKLTKNAKKPPTKSQKITELNVFRRERKNVFSSDGRVCVAEEKSQIKNKKG